MQFYIFLYFPLFGGFMAGHCVNYNAELIYSSAPLGGIPRAKLNLSLVEVRNNFTCWRK